MDKKEELLEKILDKLDSSVVDETGYKGSYLAEIWRSLWDIQHSIDKPTWKYEQDTNESLSSLMRTSRGDKGWELVSINHVDQKGTFNDSSYWCATYKRKIN